MNRSVIRKDEKAIRAYKVRRAERMRKRLDAEYEEEKHPRDENGRFVSKDGGSSANTKAVQLDTSKNILDAIKKFEDEGYETFGIRSDKDGIKTGHKFKNSHQWWQDNPKEWDPNGKYRYNKRKGMWDGGELNGVCTVGITDFPHEKDIDKALKMACRYLEGNSKLYLVGGSWSEGGNDDGESIIKDGVCLGKLEIDKNEYDSKK